MNRLLHTAAYGLIALSLFCGGGVTTEHRDAVAASHDEARVALPMTAVSRKQGMTATTCCGTSRVRGNGG
jgi:hypothetical protein